MVNIYRQKCGCLHPVLLTFVSKLHPQSWRVFIPSWQASVQGTHTSASLSRVTVRKIKEVRPCTVTCADRRAQMDTADIDLREVEFGQMTDERRLCYQCDGNRVRLLRCRNVALSQKSVVNKPRQSTLERRALSHYQSSSFVSPKSTCLVKTSH